MSGLKRAVLIATITNALLVTVAPSGAAQTVNRLPFAQPIGFHESATPYRRPSIDSIRRSANDDNPFRPGAWIWGGALTGALGLGGLAAYEASSCGKTESCMFVGPMLGLAVGVGAVGGGLIGLLVYTVIHSN